MDAQEKRKSLYFGYGSNLWRQQMENRCPDSEYIGVASLTNWRWIISTRGYANVIPSEGDIVYGLMYALTAADERKLDGYEGVPHAYIKKTIPVNYLGLPDGTYLNYGDERLRIIEALVYVDRRVTIGDPKEEYIGRMNSGIRDALREGVPREYVDKYIRPFIPEEKEKELERVEVSRDPGEVGNVPT